jgi:hypothetical protein
LLQRLSHVNDAILIIEIETGLLTETGREAGEHEKKLKLIIGFVSVFIFYFPVI